MGKERNRAEAALGSALRRTTQRDKRRGKGRPATAPLPYLTRPRRGSRRSTPRSTRSSTWVSSSGGEALPRLLRSRFVSGRAHGVRARVNQCRLVRTLVTFHASRTLSRPVPAEVDNSVEDRSWADMDPLDLNPILNRRRQGCATRAPSHGATRNARARPAAISPTAVFLPKSPSLPPASPSMSAKCFRVTGDDDSQLARFLPSVTTSRHDGVEAAYWSRSSYSRGSGPR